MLKGIAAAVVGAAAATLVLLTPASALPRIDQSAASTTLVTQTRMHGGHHFGGFHRGGHFGFRRGLVFGGPVFYGYSYARGCGWLRHRALATGSHYWWRRYRACRHGY